MRTETDKNNDLTGQVDWDGTGFPPVGVDCVFHPDNTLWGFERVKPYKGKVLCYEGEQFVFMLDHKLYGIKQESIILSRTDKGEFRKSETPQQREERERIELERANAVKDMFKLVPEHIKISMMPLEPNPIKEALFALYDAGYRINKVGE
ncbi:hypothetical protein [Vibrio cholerae]|uniref:hypothetical protein n=1 Tax=Vibrio cholerae TaxID=666 RepID=UPI00155E6DDB|nr:hypothetical protein [Vibrio cholerae]NOE09409.1 hypothetical protein [Vibrio cholerae]